MKTVARKCKKPQLTVFYDVGYQIRASGHLYNSIYGHEFMLGVRTGEVMSDIFVENKFTRCDSAAWLSINPEVNYCPPNYKGSPNKLGVKCIQFNNRFILQEGFYRWVNCFWWLINY